eukprot:CAMPEP_0119102696 /NCGR_PEP_ID=MMETSP1180-20130426/1349_1 /TAXON_ID=3052 ORGANISM="Chlamydomonas cf sp, Strain CCMP681" /NCGR_SAMPLE_ID=MMETSP1180 /ASSEMBLY_ACC=CAM_ASM_000741 /LENGTH=400 /DNA_ID=CAMNT_0007087023 /DNA_START=70 /DNA_END=1272 /DNA_ORIENTATION=-
MQLLVACGGHTGTLALHCSPEQDSVYEVKQRLASSCPTLGPAERMVLLCGGRTMHDAQPLSTCYGLCSGSTLMLTSRLLGGGGDGGSTGAESRSCYLEMYMGKKPDKVNPAEALQARWTRCHLTGADLQPPCVVDEVGNLYNKDMLLEALLTKTLPGHLAYITGLKNVTDLKFENHPQGKRGLPAVAAKGLHQPGNDCDFCCPITGVEFNGRFKFMVHRPTGRVISEKGIKELPSVVQELLGGAPSADDWIPVNPTDEQQEQLKVKQAALMAAEREKKAKKSAAKLAAAHATIAAAAAASAGAGPAHSGHTGGDVSNGKDQEEGALVAAGSKKRSSPSSTTGNAPPAAALARVVGMPPPVKKVKGSTYASLFTSSLKAGPGGDKETYCCRSVSQRGLHMG